MRELFPSVIGPSRWEYNYPTARRAGWLSLISLLSGLEHRMTVQLKRNNINFSAAGTSRLRSAFALITVTFRRTLISRAIKRLSSSEARRHGPRAANLGTNSFNRRDCTYVTHEFGFSPCLVVRASSFFLPALVKSQFTRCDRKRCDAARRCQRRKLMNMCAVKVYLIRPRPGSNRKIFDARCCEMFVALRQFRPRMRRRFFV